MANDPRRIGEVIVEFTFPANQYTDEEKTLIEYTARNCPVAKSLHPDLKQTMIFKF
jgi:putative redox protein